MAKNTGNNFRRGAVTARTQFERPDGNYQKRNERTGEFMSVKNGGSPFKGVAKEPDGRDGDEGQTGRGVGDQFRRHLLPAIRPARECLLPVWRKLIPALAIRFQHRLLLGRELGPRHTRYRLRRTE